MKAIGSIILLLGTILILGCCPNTANAQNKSVTLDTAGLPANVKAVIVQKIQQDEITSKIETSGKWVGMGREIGIAAREGLTAVKDVTLDISKSDLGKTVIFLVAWKVAGRDFARIGISLLFAIVSIWLISRSYFRLFSKTILVERSGWWIFGTRKYQPRNTDENVLDGLDNSWVAGLHWCCLVIMLGISAAIAFL